MRVRRLLAAILVSLSAARVSGRPNAEDETPEPNPGRPTVSTPATLSPTSYLQLETGLFFAHGSPGVANRLSLTHVVKLSVDRRVELLLVGEPVVTATGGGTHEGDLFAGVQLVALSVQNGPTVAVSYLRQLHESPAPDFDIGSFRQAGLLLVSSDFLGFHCDANAFLLEETEGSERATQSGGSLSVSHPAGRATISGELWRFTQPLQGGNFAAGMLLGASYPARRNVVLDFAVNHGLTRTSTKWEILAGFTYLLPQKLW
jgi:hypothetical protein